MSRRALVFLLAVCPAFAQPPRIATDPRIVLLSIVFHLAGNPEYNQCRVKSYCEAVDQYFAPFKDDEAIRLARELNERSGINYDAVMSMAIHIKDVETLAERLPFDAPNTRLESRWHAAEARRFLAALRQFVNRSKFSEFLAAHADLYEFTSRGLRSLVETQADLGWFDKFFGAKPGARFIVVPALINGGGNYGPSLRAEDGREEMYAILGVWQVDADNQPKFGKNFLPTLVHEFAHSYVNPLAARFPALNKSGDAVFASVKREMQAQAYASGETLVCESLVRASTARYILAHDGEKEARADIQGEQGRSFVWTDELFQLLGGYEADREHFPTLEAFMPKVVTFFDALPARVGTMIQEFDAKRPKIVSMTPANEAKDVDPATTKMVLKFDRALRGGVSLCYASSQEFYPKFGKSSYDESRTTFTMEVHLEPNHDYAFRLNCAPGFVAEDGMSLKDTTVKWHTRAAQ